MRAGSGTVRFCHVGTCREISVCAKSQSLGYVLQSCVAPLQPTSPLANLSDNMAKTSQVKKDNRQASCTCSDMHEECTRTAFGTFVTRHNRILKT
ncbi:hypothetical protein BCV69DRAFT_158847 [Microstroma glucosiphilum]|uniref:Uncharacterized protein n=1 Tax=Pseudomicrostroma glucosiphilum TaxID=1684307 RepID=A0A316UAL7_9BASI|nr:hypothetical protein BCV69DRAFT_158847 [Pseudomicrostroma glucosiphilum]PWN21898.1 hypothetical protein BCV69DRAFT_158847 [Pseudomicrostroma glucosiphilum]